MAAHEASQLAFVLQFYDDHSHNDNLSNGHRQKFSSCFSTLIRNQNHEIQSELINLAVYFANKDGLSDIEIAQCVCSHVENRKLLEPKM